MNEFGTGGGPILDCDIDNDVEVPEVWFGLSDDQWWQLQESVEPLSELMIIRWWFNAFMSANRGVKKHGYKI